MRESNWVGFAFENFFVRELVSEIFVALAILLSWFLTFWG